MRVGVPTEIKSDERRVGLTPNSVHELVLAGIDVVVQSGAGVGIGASDETYATAGADIALEAAEVFATADMIVKVKEPQAVERAMLREGQVLFTYLHLAPDPDANEATWSASGAVCIAYETGHLTDRGGLPLLAPMSKVAGRMSHSGLSDLLPGAAPTAALGMLLGGVPGVEPAKVVDAWAAASSATHAAHDGGWHGCRRLGG